MQTIAVMELKGFTTMADVLSCKMKHIGIESARVRASIVKTVRISIDTAKALQQCNEWYYLGGDTWFFVFDNLKEGIGFSSLLMGLLLESVTKKGLFYIKPSITINMGKLEIQNGRFLDNCSILAYRVADKGLPFKLALLNDSILESQKYEWIKFVEDSERITEISGEKHNIRFLDWQNIVSNLNPSLAMPDFELPSFLLDGEMLFSENKEDAINNLINHQKKTSNVYTFGGPVDVQQSRYFDYVKSLIAQAISNKNYKIFILNYLPIEKPEICYIWIEICSFLSEVMKGKALCKLFVLRKDSMRPISFHVYDSEIVFLGLRSYSMEYGVTTMSSSVMFKNERIAKIFIDEFEGNWKNIASFDAKTYHKILSNFNEIDPETREKAREIINELKQYVEGLK
jgi:hypothetical protein